MKPGQYVIDIEPLTNSNNEDIVWDPERKTAEERKDEDDPRYQFIRGASVRSTIDGSGVSGSLDVHFHTGTAPSPISTINENKKYESGLAKSYLETDLPVYEQEIDDFETTKIQPEKSRTDLNMLEKQRSKVKNTPKCHPKFG